MDCSFDESSPRRVTVRLLQHHSQRMNGGGLSYTLTARRLFQRNAVMTPAAVNAMWKGLLAEHLGMRFVETGPDRVVAELDIRDHLRTVRGTLHGGALMALADAVGGTAALINLPEGAATATIESKTNFFAAGRDRKSTRLN